MNDNYLNKLKQIYNEYKDFNCKKIPLCAAETYISDFVRQGMSSIFEGKYIQGYKTRIIEKDNIGSNKIFPLLALVEELCEKIYGAKYVDSRTLSGMNCMMILVMSLIDKQSTVAITLKETGGHPSLANILDNLGISYIGIPYDFKSYQIDYTALNALLDSKRIDYIVFCQSDILAVPDFSRIKLPDTTGLIYDGSQTLGLMAANLVPNPLRYFEKAVLIGGTHKTLPGPTCGLIMTSYREYIDRLDYTISPTLLRNIQPNNIAALCLALIELMETDYEYEKRIVETANLLGEKLERKNITVAKLNNNTYTNTHQLFLLFDEILTTIIYDRALKYNITLNKRVSNLYTGIRIGVQEISRFNYTESDLEQVAELLYYLQKSDEDEKTILQICNNLQLIKTPRFILDDIFMG